MYNFFYEKSQNRMRLSVTYKNHHISYYDRKELTFSPAIENLVKTPISIARMFLEINGHSYEFFWVPQIVYYSNYKSGETVLNEIKLYSIGLNVIKIYLMTCYSPRILKLRSTQIKGYANTLFLLIIHL